jgi:hypothetical protein
MGFLLVSEVSTWSRCAVDRVTATGRRIVVVRCCEVADNKSRSEL